MSYLNLQKKKKKKDHYFGENNNMHFCRKNNGTPYVGCTAPWSNPHALSRAHLMSMSLLSSITCEKSNFS